MSFSISKSAQVTEEGEVKRTTMKPVVSGTTDPEGSGYQTVLDIPSGKGELVSFHLLNDTTPKAVKITIDGVVFENHTSSSMSENDTYLAAMVTKEAGDFFMNMFEGGPCWNTLVKVNFASSLKIEIEAGSVLAYDIAYGLEE